MYDLLWAPDEMSDCSDTKQQPLPRFHIYRVKEKSIPIMDIFGKTSPSTTKKTPFQSELAAKMRERKSKGLAADLTETEEDDDEALASDDGESKAFSM